MRIRTGTGWSFLGNLTSGLKLLDKWIHRLNSGLIWMIYKEKREVEWWWDGVGCANTRPGRHMSPYLWRTLLLIVLSQTWLELIPQPFVFTITHLHPCLPPWHVHLPQQYLLSHQICYVQHAHTHWKLHPCCQGLVKHRHCSLGHSAW